MPEPGDPIGLPLCEDEVPVGMKDWMALAGTKYVPILMRSVGLVFFVPPINALRMPCKHNFSASNTPEPDLPLVSTSLIIVGHLFLSICVSMEADSMRECVMGVLVKLGGVTTITCASACGGVSQSGKLSER